MPALRFFLFVQGLYAPDKKYHVIVGGTDRLPHAFARRLGDKIRYGAAVVKIVHTCDGVRVVFLQAGTQHEIEAHHIICTVPFTMLTRMEVSPNFSFEKQEAIKRVGYQPATRVFLQVRRRFWLDRGVPGSALTDLPIERVSEHPLDESVSAHGRGILESQTFGEQAERVAAMPKSERINYTIHEMEKLHPGFHNYFEGGTTKCWQEDPWVQGAYSSLSLGGITSWLSQIARPEGRVHFAGEHTSLWANSMEGALESGNRTAREVNDAA